MKITITGRHMDMTDAIKDYVEKGLEKVRGHFDRVIDVDVVLSVEKRRHIAEINLHANGLRINAKESSEDMYVSVDTAVNKVDKQIRKHKGRIMRHQPRRAQEELMHHLQVIEVHSDEDDGGDEAESAMTHRVIFHEKIETRSMSVDEAALQLELQEDAFLVFSNVDTGQVNVICARDDGTYSLIEPQA